MSRCPEPIPAPQPRRRYLVLALVFLGAALAVGWLWWELSRGLR